MGDVNLDRRRAALLLAAALAAPQAARAGDDAPPPEVIAGRLDDMARLTVPIWINGRGPYRFVVDTGSNHSLIAEDLAQGLALPSGQVLTINTVAGPARTPSSMARRMVIGEQDNRDVVLALAPRQTIGGAGLLGIDRLGSLRLTLDYQRRRIAIGRSGPRLEDRNAFSLRARAQAGRLALVGARVADVPVVAFLDSGSEVTIGNLALRRRLGAKARLIGEGAVPVVGATGLEARGELAVLPTLRLGGLDVQRLPAVFADLHTFRVWDLQDEPALLVGVDLLRMFKSVDLDFGRGRVLFHVDGMTPARGGRLRDGGADPFAVLRQAG